MPPIYEDGIILQAHKYAITDNNAVTHKSVTDNNAVVARYADERCNGLASCKQQETNR